MKKRTSSSFRVDEQAYLTMGSVCVLALLVLAFRYGTSHPCYPIRIVPSAASFTVGSPVTLKAETHQAKSYEWNFGDGTSTTEFDPETVHIYIRAGKYTVVVTIDGQCSEMQIVSIGEAPITVNKNLPLMIIGPDTAYVGKPVNYEDNNPASTAWAWHFEGGEMVDAYTKRASFTYRTPGLKTIILQINHRPDLSTSLKIIVIDPKAETAVHAPKIKHDDHSGRPVIITVHDSPTTAKLLPPVETKNEPPKPPPVTATMVSDDKWSSMFMQVIDGTMVQEDFSNYLCNNLNITVQYNGSNMTFAAMCAELKKIKRKKVKKITVTQVREKDTNCVLSLTVTLKKSSILDIF
jgi:hypothetical protein